MRGSRIFVTGGTGFVGTWLLESLAWADRRLGSISRSTCSRVIPTAAVARLPSVAAHDGFTFVRGDVRMPLPHLAPADAVIHAATPASAALNRVGSRAR